MSAVFGVCNLSIVPVRAEPSDKAEMTTQLLFGDSFEILELTEKWVRIKTVIEDYLGWIDRKQYKEVSDEEFFLTTASKTVLGMGVTHIVKKESTGELLYLAAGSTIPNPHGSTFRIADDTFTLHDADALKTPSQTNFLSDVEATAKFYLHSPYLWGGRTLFGIDCSGFTQLVFKQFGIAIKRDAWQQAEQGELVGFLQEAKVGDLAFFDNTEGRIVHVGIMLDSNTIIHASGRVKIDTIDTQGIYSSELKRHTHRLRIIKRFV